MLLGTQWRVSLAGAVGLDLNVFIPVIRDKGWDLETALELLGVIEGKMLKREEHSRLG